MEANRPLIYGELTGSNGSRPYYEPHAIFIKFVKYDGCSATYDLPYSERCEHITKDGYCQDSMQYINYIKILYCFIEKAESPAVDWIYIGVLFFLVFYLLQVMGLLIGNFFISSINYFAKRLRLSQSLAGATILAVANSLAGIYTSLLHIKGSTTDLFNGSHASAIFTHSLVAGAVLVIRPFHIYRPIYIRDALFLLTLLAYIEYILKDDRIELLECIPLFLFYIVFLITVTIDTIIIKRLSKDVRRKLKMLQAGETNEKLEKELEELQEEGVMEILMKDTVSVLDIETTRSGFVAEHANSRLFQQFLSSINPVPRDDWREASCFQRFLLVIRAPFFIFFLLICPRVDYNLPNHGWSKLLNMLHVITGPFFFISIHKQIADWSLFGVSIYFYLVAISVPIMIIVYFTSRTDSPPVYHLIYAVHAIWICMVLIRMMASETSSLTYTIGMASQMSPTFIMVTLTTWEGGIGSLIANVALAYRGYQRMSFAACFGSPLFSMPVTFGARYLYRVLTSESGVAKVGQGPLGSTIHVILFTIIFFPLMGNLFARDKGRKSLGVYRLLFYPIFLLFALLAEFEIIHGHGTDHTDQRVKLN